MSYPLDQPELQDPMGLEAPINVHCILYNSMITLIIIILASIYI